MNCAIQLDQEQVQLRQTRLVPVIIITTSLSGAELCCALAVSKTPCRPQQLPSLPGISPNSLSTVLLHVSRGRPLLLLPSGTHVLKCNAWVRTLVYSESMTQPQLLLFTVQLVVIFRKYLLPESLQLTRNQPRKKRQTSPIS